MRGAAPGFSPSRREKKKYSAFSPNISPAVPGRSLHLKIFLRFGRFPMWLSFPETSAVRSCRCPFSRYIKFFLYSEHLGAVYSYHCC